LLEVIKVLYDWLLGTISPTFYAQLLNTKIPKLQKIQSVVSPFCLLLGSSHEKAGHRTLMKLTPGFNFINVLLSAFAQTGPKSVKKAVKSFSHFEFLGSTPVKAARKMLMTLTPGVNFINVLRTAFTLIDPKSVKRY
jgi:hypothetical protein